MRRIPSGMVALLLLSGAAQAQWTKTIDCPADRVYRDVRIDAGRNEYCEHVMAGSLAVMDGPYRGWYNSDFQGYAGNYKEGREIGKWKECDRFGRCAQKEYPEAYPEEKQRAGFRPELPIVYTGGQYVIDFTSCRQTEYTRLNGDSPDLEVHIGGSAAGCTVTYFPTDAMRRSGTSTTCTVPYQTGKRGFRSLELLDELPQYCARNIIRTGPYMSSVDPDRGTGAEQVFTAEYSLGNNGVGIAQARLHLQDQATSRTDRCVVRYDPVSKGLFLLSDAGKYLGPIAPGSNASLWNSRCLLAGCSTAEVSGDKLKVRFAIRFNPDQFAGPHNMFLELVDTERRASPAPVYGQWTVPSEAGKPASEWPSDRSCPRATRVQPLGVFSSSVVDCSDVSGEWSDPETGGKWSLSQSKGPISGSLTITKSQCGDVVWRVAGQMKAGVASLTAGSPEPAVDKCGVAAARSITATLTPDCKTGPGRVNVEK